MKLDAKGLTARIRAATGNKRLRVTSATCPNGGGTLFYLKHATEADQLWWDGFSAAIEGTRSGRVFYEAEAANGRQ